jgi:hypothetical protein
MVGFFFFLDEGKLFVALSSSDSLILSMEQAAVVQKSSFLFFLSVWISVFVAASAQASDGSKKPILGNIHLCMM